MKANYHQSLTHTVPLDVITQHADGTVDLGTGREVSVRRISVSDVPKRGHAVLIRSISVAEAKATAEAEAKAAAEGSADTLVHSASSVEAKAKAK
jgi:hypothetical protein